MLKKILLMFLLSVIFFSLKADNLNIKKITEDEKYYPISKGNLLFFKAYKKSEPNKLIKVKAEVIGIEKKDGKDYYYFYAPNVNIRYLIRNDKDGVYMRVIKYPFPIFNFSIEVDIVPEICFLKFPLKVGTKWEQKAKAKTTFLFMPIVRNITSSFEIVKRETIKTDVGEIDTYVVHAKVDQGDGKSEIEKYWYGKNLGYVKADTNVHFAEIVGYSIIDEETGERKEKLPEGVDKYE